MSLYSLCDSSFFFRTQSLVHTSRKKNPQFDIPTSEYRQQNDHCKEICTGTGSDNVRVLFAILNLCIDRDVSMVSPWEGIKHRTMIR
jgi:hypothetical protein